jgi:hypothetical protein
VRNTGRRNNRPPAIRRFQESRQRGSDTVHWQSHLKPPLSVHSATALRHRVSCRQRWLGFAVASTWSRLKLALSWLGGNSLNVASHWPTVTSFRA